MWSGDWGLISSGAVYIDLWFCSHSSSADIWRWKQRDDLIYLPLPYVITKTFEPQSPHHGHKWELSQGDEWFEPQHVQLHWRSWSQDTNTDSRVVLASHERITCRHVICSSTSSWPNDEKDLLESCMMNLNPGDHIACRRDIARSQSLRSEWFEVSSAESA